MALHAHFQRLQASQDQKSVERQSVAPVSDLKPAPQNLLISALDPTTAPPSRSPWPPRYFVAE